MPSGHAQSVFFSTIFIYLALKQKNILFLYIIISFIVCYQRVYYEYHTLSQVIVGSIVGSSFAYFVYYLVREKIKGKIREKPDDYGPI
jgi:membrane-associated phospholipid phosphatase